MTQLSPKFQEAFLLAATFHATQTRKGTCIPYISHLMSVSALALEHGGDEEQAIAALLHDAVEDADNAEEAIQRRALIQEKFGARVAAMVDGCTDGTPDTTGVKSDWHTRKRAYLAHLKEAPQSVLLVSCADKLHNARAILGDLRTVGPVVFERFTAGKGGTLWYYRELANIFLESLPGPLAYALAGTVEEMLTEAASHRL